MNATLAKKLLMKPGTPFAVVGAPDGHAALVGVGGAVKGAGLVLLYATSKAEVLKRLPALLRALDPKARLWVAYPKAKKLGTDLDRDLLAGLLAEHGLDAVRMVSIDATWSAMWFKAA